MCSLKPPRHISTLPWLCRNETIGSGPWSAIVKVADVSASDRSIAQPRWYSDALSRFWTHFSGLQVARMAAIRLGLPTMFITRVRL